MSKHILWSCAEGMPQVMVEIRGNNNGVIKAESSHVLKQ